LPAIDPLIINSPFPCFSKIVWKKESNGVIIKNNKSLFIFKKRIVNKRLK